MTDPFVLLDPHADRVSSEMELSETAWESQLDYEGRCECPGRHAQDPTADGRCATAPTWRVVIRRNSGANDSAEEMCEQCALLARRIHRPEVFWMELL